MIKNQKAFCSYFQFFLSLICQPSENANDITILTLINQTCVYYLLIRGRELRNQNYFRGE